MKAVIYHAEAKALWEVPQNLYKTLFENFRRQCHKHKIEVIHLSTEGHEGWGDVNIHYAGDPLEIVYNREVFFTKFLEEAEDDTYWFAEPDQQILKMFPALETDLAVTLRPGDGVAITPSFRLAKKTALPFFKEVLSYFDGRKDWHGDSGAFAKMYKAMGEPGFGIKKYKDMTIDLRRYEDYIAGGRYIHHYKFKNKIGFYNECKRDMAT